MTTTETLTFVRNATMKQNRALGVIYLHTWATGKQELLFDDHDAAARFKTSFGVKHEAVEECEDSCWLGNGTQNIDK